MTESDLRNALRVCYDPELRINIVDLGRIASIRIEHDAEAPGLAQRDRVTVTLFPRNEEHDAILAAQIVNRLYGIREISRAEVRFDDAPAWSPDRMNAAAKHELGRQRGLIQIG
ncbi:MAG: DUF59 domain-containing protein [Terriglobus roseus]|nr:DUF59 domain-containing protein [Terriglobus roseus]